MNKFFIASITILLLLGCSNDKAIKHSKDTPTVQLHVSKPVNSPNTFRDFFSKERDFFWAAKQADTSGYLVTIVFEKDLIVYQFHGQCLYYFFTNYYHTKKEQVDLLWSYKSDCLLDMDLLENSNGVKKFPKHGDVFSEYILINDSVIKAKYNFPEWVSAVNKTAKDSLFPTYFYLQK